MLGASLKSQSAVTSVNDLCRSYLDLKYHFDPAAGSIVGLVAEDARLGRFDPQTIREHISALRSVAGAVEELEPDTLAAEIDRTALLGEIRTAIFRLEHEQPNVRNPGFWLGHLFQGLYALLARTDTDPAERAPAVAARLADTPAFLDSGRATISEPPAVFVDLALSMLGGGGELIAQVVSVFGSAAPTLATSSSEWDKRLWSRWSASGPRSRARSSPTPIPMPSPSARSSSAAGCITSTR